MDPTLTVLTFGSLAAGAAALGAVPLIGRERLPIVWIGWANALAAGLMLGAAYALMVTGLELKPTASHQDGRFVVRLPDDVGARARGLQPDRGGLERRIHR